MRNCVASGWRRFFWQGCRRTQQFCDLWILGVLGAILGTFLSTLGLGLQKLTHEKLKAEGKQVENYCQYPLWVLGIACLAVDAVLDVWTLGWPRPHCRPDGLDGACVERNCRVLPRWGAIDPEGYHWYCYHRCGIHMCYYFFAA